MRKSSNTVDQAFIDYDEGRTTTVELYEALRDRGSINLWAEVTRDVAEASSFIRGSFRHVFHINSHRR